MLGCVRGALIVGGAGTLEAGRKGVIPSAKRVGDLVISGRCPTAFGLGMTFSARLTLAAALTLGIGLGAAKATPGAVRFSQLTKAQFEAVMAGESDVVVEFRSGDVLPLEMVATGDLLVTRAITAVPLEVADTFYLRSDDDDDIELSRDGVTFVPFREAISGRLSLSATAPDGGRVSGLELKLQAEFPRS